MNGSMGPERLARISPFLGASLAMPGQAFQGTSPFLGAALRLAQRGRERTERFIQLTREAMRRTGLVQVELNPCEVWTPEELLSIMRMADPPLRVGVTGSTIEFVLRDVRVRCPDPFVEWDFDLLVERSRGFNWRGSVTVVGRQTLLASLDPPLERPIYAAICYRDLQILRLQPPPEVARSEAYIRDVITRQLAGRMICVNLTGLASLGIG